MNHYGHLVSGDKSKSIYSSDIENNTLFDANQFLMEDQSNSSNFFSNINNSNSHLYMDESQLITEKRDPSQQPNNYGALPQHTSSNEIKSKKPQQMRIQRNNSQNQLKLYPSTQTSFNNPKYNPTDSH